jgi:GTPase SAR1 family protein
LKIQVDCAGQGLCTPYFRGSTGAIIAFSFENAASFANVNGWLNQIKDNASSNIVVAIVGCQSDINDKEKQVTLQQVQVCSHKNKKTITY